MDISNKTLALLLVGAMVVSLAGTMMSLNKLGEVSITGMPVLGNVTLQVDSLVSITTVDNPSISFGQCDPVAETLQVLNSEEGGDTTTACDESGNLPNQIAIRNNGNVNAVVNVSTSAVGSDDGGDFLGASSTGSYIEYKITNNGHSSTSFGGGCDSGTFPSTYTRFTATGPTTFNVCDDLDSSAGSNTDNSVLMDIQIGFPGDVSPGDYSVEFTFTATQVI